METNVTGDGPPPNPTRPRPGRTHPAPVCRPDPPSTSGVLIQSPPSLETDPSTPKSPVLESEVPRPGEIPGRPGSPPTVSTQNRH